MEVSSETSDLNVHRVLSHIPIYICSSLDEDKDEDHSVAHVLLTPDQRNSMYPFQRRNDVIEVQ